VSAECVRHRVHVGWDANSGFQTQQADTVIGMASSDDLDTNVERLLKTIGMRFGDLNKRELHTVYQIVDQLGGVNAVKNELKQREETVAAAAQAPKPPAPKMSAVVDAGEGSFCGQFETLYFIVLSLLEPQMLLTF